MITEHGDVHGVGVDIVYSFKNIVINDDKYVFRGQKSAKFQSGPQDIFPRFITIPYQAWSKLILSLLLVELMVI